MNPSGYALLLVFFNLTAAHALNCPKNYFALPGMDACQKLLNCHDIKGITISKEIIGKGAVKIVHRAFWHGYTLALNALKNQNYSEDFQSGLDVLKLLNPSQFIVKLIGFCEERNIYLTEFHKLGNASNFEQILKTGSKDSVKTRLSFCLNYVEILEFIHSKVNGVRVMCDSNDLSKTLSQYLISENLRLILNDVDALPSVLAKNGIKCGHRQIFSVFVAPEQLWPHSNKTFDDSFMPVYNEKTDIWKVPSVCEFFLGNIKNHNIVKYKLFEIHKQCRNSNPSKRPSASDVKKVYSELLSNLPFHSEL